MNVGECDKHIGKTASAWSAYQGGGVRRQARQRSRGASSSPTARPPPWKAHALAAPHQRQGHAEASSSAATIRRSARGVWVRALPRRSGPAYKIEATAPGCRRCGRRPSPSAPQRDLQVIEITHPDARRPRPRRPRRRQPLAPARAWRSHHLVRRPGASARRGSWWAASSAGWPRRPPEQAQERLHRFNVCTTAAEQSSSSPPANTKALVSTIGLAAGGKACSPRGSCCSSSSRPGAPPGRGAPGRAAPIPGFEAAGPSGGLSLVGAFWSVPARGAARNRPAQGLERRSGSADRRVGAPA